MSAFIHITGRLTKDPVVEERNGRKIARFSIAAATSHRMNEKEKALMSPNSKSDYATNFYECTVWSTERCGFFLSRAKQGARVYADGDFVITEYINKDGQRRSSNQININWVELTEDSQGAGNNASTAAPAEPSPVATPMPAAANDLPF